MRPNKNGKSKMNHYNPNIHHRKSIRLKGYDYSQEGFYFITICCEGRLCRFGNIENGEMKLNEFGTIAFDSWTKTPQLRPNVALGAFVIMPNHMHGIIHLLGRGELHSPNELPNDIRGECTSPNELPHDIGGECNSPNELPNDIRGECNSPLPRGPSQTIGAIVRGYKSSVTKQLGLMGFEEKLWQRNYYEHIIRNEQSYNTISNYIINNVAKWQADKFYKV